MNATTLLAERMVLVTARFALIQRSNQVGAAPTPFRTEPYAAQPPRSEKFVLAQPHPQPASIIPNWLQPLEQATSNLTHFCLSGRSGDVRVVSLAEPRLWRLKTLLKRNGVDNRFSLLTTSRRLSPSFVHNDMHSPLQ